MAISHATFIQTIRDHLPDGATVIAAISGGADSMALLNLLASTRTELNLTVIIATLDHQLRPGSADDVAFVQAAAAGYQLPCVAGRADVPQLQQLHGDGLEAAARRARYAFLVRVVRQHNADCIMTAHHADDQVETLLLHLLRGTGTQGLTGMTIAGSVPSAPDVMLLRPLLHVRRAAIEAYCDEYGIVYRDDPTNTDTRLQRNVVRHQILPRLRQFNPQIDRAILRLAQVMRVEADFVAQQVATLTSPFIQHTAQTVTIERAAFKTWHPAVQQRVIVDAVRHLGAEAAYTHILHACEVAREGAVGALAQFPGDVRLRVDYHSLMIEFATADLTAAYPQLEREQSLVVPGATMLGTYILQAGWQPFDGAQMRLAISPDDALLLRTRLPGDRWQPLGMAGKHRKLKDWFIDRKIPQAARDHLPLLTVNGRIAALLLPDHWPVADWAAVRKDTAHILYLSLRKI